jgi:peptidoglycan/xylan/chitin deacetylase (PgdA/CDA1 family)
MKVKAVVVVLAPLGLLMALGTAPSTGAQTPAASRDEKMIAVTIDDLPVNGADPGLAGLRSMNERLLASLKRHGVPAIGFLNESKLYRLGEVDARIALMAAWLDQGLELGNHTSAHPSFNKVGRGAFQEDVIRGETISRLLLEPRGQKLRWFRHPFLHTGPNAEERAGFEAFLSDRGYRIAPVTVDAWDWYYTYRYAIAKRRADSALMERVAAAYLTHFDADLDYAESFSKRLFGRNIRHVFLMHENELAGDHFGQVAERLKARGYRFISLEEAMADPAYRHEDRFIGDGVNWFIRWAVTEGITDLPRSPKPPEWLESLEADRSPYDLSP